MAEQLSIFVELLSPARRRPRPRAVRRVDAAAAGRGRRARAAWPGCAASGTRRAQFGEARAGQRRGLAPRWPGIGDPAERRARAASWAPRRGTAPRAAACPPAAPGSARRRRASRARQLAAGGHGHPRHAARGGLALQRQRLLGVAGVGRQHGQRARRPRTRASGSRARPATAAAATSAHSAPVSSAAIAEPPMPPTATRSGWRTGSCQGAALGARERLLDVIGNRIRRARPCRLGSRVAERAVPGRSCRGSVLVRWGIPPPARDPGRGSSAAGGRSRGARARAPGRPTVQRSASSASACTRFVRSPPGWRPSRAARRRRTRTVRPRPGPAAAPRSGDRRPSRRRRRPSACAREPPATVWWMLRSTAGSSGS